MSEYGITYTNTSRSSEKKNLQKDFAFSNSNESIQFLGYRKKV